ncbi:MAG: efflux RND transporter permease subunit [Candidatus Hydrogenedentota bacterium]
MRIPKFAVSQPVTIIMLFLGICLLGIVSLTKLPIDMFPDIEPPVASVLTFWPGSSATDIESEITEKLEDYLNTVNNLETLTSKSLDNFSGIFCKFEWGTDMDIATNDIRDRLEFAKNELPDDAHTPMIFRFTSATAPIMFMTISSSEKTWPRLYHLVDRLIADELKRIPGVGTIEIYGGLRRRINVYFDIKKIEGYGLSIDKINDILEKENLNLPSGSIKSGATEYFLRVPARFRSIDEIKNIVVGYFANRAVYLKDIAGVKDDFKPLEMNGWSNGKRALILILQKQSGKNTVEISRRIRDRLEEIKNNLPQDVEISIAMDMAENILNAIKNLKNTLYWAIFLVILVTLIFLRRIRSSLIIALVLPFTLIIPFIFIYLGEYTINVISLLSIAVASGIVVDNGIVVLENIIRHFETKGEIRSSSVLGAGEVGRAITASSMTTIVVFLPLIFVKGLAGIMFKQLGYIIIITVLASLGTALTLIPMLASRWITSTPELLKKRKGLSGTIYKITEDLFKFLERCYGNLLSWSLSHRKTVLILAISIFISSVSLIPFISTSFLPEVDSGDVSVVFRLVEGTRIEETNRVVESVMDDIKDIVKKQEIKNTFAFNGSTEKGIGIALGFEEGANCGEVGFKLVDRSKRNRSAIEIANLLRERVKKIPGVSKLKVTAISPLTAIMRGWQKPISIEVQGSIMEDNLNFAEKLVTCMKTIPGLVDIEISQKNPRPELWLEIDREKIASLGLNVPMIGLTLRNYFYGKEVTEFRDGGESFDIFTRFTENDKDRLKNLMQAPVFTPDGRMIRLRNIARVVDGRGPIEIQRKNRQNIIMVNADIYGRSLGEVTQDIQKALRKMDIPSGVSINFGGEVEEQRKAFKDLIILLILGVVLVYMVMASLFENLKDPFIIMFSVPFAITGVIYTFYIADITLSLISFMGIIMLTGIVVNNSIILIDYIYLLKKQGYGLFEAIIEGGRRRLRPVLMTTFTTIFALLPMAFFKGMGAEVWGPLGMTMLGGLAVSTLVTLILVPTMYYMFRVQGSSDTNQTHG